MKKIPQDYKKKLPHLCDCGNVAVMWHAKGPSCQECYVKYEKYYKALGQRRQHANASREYEDHERKLSKKEFDVTKHLIARAYRRWLEKQGQSEETIKCSRYFVY